MVTFEIKQSVSQKGTAYYFIACLMDGKELYREFVKEATYSWLVKNIKA